MKTHRSQINGTRGAVMLVVLMFVFASSIAVTAWMYLSAARLNQSERMANAMQRHISWGNSQAINQQYAFTFGYQNSITRTASTSLLATGWGGADADAYSAMQTFNSTQRYAGGTYSYAFKNIFPAPTSDGAVYFTRTSADSDSSQTEHVYFYNYLKTYPAPLLGDLLIIHAKPAAAGTPYYSDNLQVNGRVVIMEPGAITLNTHATSCLNTTTGSNSAKIVGATTTLLPQNYPDPIRTNAGYGGTGAAYAITDGSLNMINNTNFAANSLSAATYTTYASNANSGTTTSAVQVLQQATPTYAAPTTTPYNYTYTSPMKTITIRLLDATLTHCRLTAAFDQVILQGVTTAADYTTQDSLAPIIIWVDNASVRDVRLVGENNRRIILALGQGTGQTVYMASSGTSAVAGGPLRWRMQLINEYRSLYIAPPTGVNVTFTGSIRTNWSITCTDTTATLRYNLNRETSPGALETMMPRDGWFEPYFLIR